MPCGRSIVTPTGGVRRRMVPGSVHTWHWQAACVLTCKAVGVIPNFLWWSNSAYVFFGGDFVMSFLAFARISSFRHLAKLFVPALVRCLPPDIKHPPFILPFVNVKNVSLLINVYPSMWRIHTISAFGASMCSVTFSASLICGKRLPH